MNMWHEKYRPDSLDTYFGNQDIVRISVNWINSVLKGNPITKGLLYYGPPGTGKTALAFVLKEVFDIPMIYRNASDKSKKKDIQKYTSAGVMKPLGKKKSIVVLDEAESIRTDLSDVIEFTNAIIITNDKYQMNKNIRTSLTNLDFKFPNKKEKQDYMEYILSKEEKTLDFEQKKKIINVSKSFRAVAKNTQLASMGVEPTKEARTDLGLYEEINQLFEGTRKGYSNIKPDDLLKWCFDNGGSPGLIVVLDRILGKTPRNDYRSWRYVYDLIQFTGASNAQYPQFFKYLSEYRSYKK